MEHYPGTNHGDSRLSVTSPVEWTTLGPFSTTEHGNTDGSQFGVKGQIGYNFVVDNLLHDPLLGLAWEQVKVDDSARYRTA